MRGFRFHRLPSPARLDRLRPHMLDQRPARARPVRTYAVLVGVPAVVLFAILRVGAARFPDGRAALVAVRDASPSPAATAPDLSLLLVQITGILVGAVTPKAEELVHALLGGSRT